MHNAKMALVAAAVVTALSLTACSSSQPAPNNAAPAAEQKSAKKISVPDGSKQMLKVLADLKVDIDKNDAAKAKTDADALEASWSTFEDDVKALNKEIYGKIEEQLDPLTAGAKAATLDKKVLSDAAAKLELLLTPLAQ